MNSEEQGAQALHMSDGNNHIVGLKSLKVMLCKDSGMWFAQGLEIDYAACGNTIEETQENFLQGLKLTIQKHLEMHGSIEKMLKVSPQEVWDEYFKSDVIKQKLTTFDFYESQASEEQQIEKYVPFKDIAFLELNAA